MAWSGTHPHSSKSCVTPPNISEKLKLHCLGEGHPLKQFHGNLLTACVMRWSISLINVIHYV